MLKFLTQGQNLGTVHAVVCVRIHIIIAASVHIQYAYTQRARKICERGFVKIGT